MDNIIQQERETNSSATTALKEYVKSKLEESFQILINEKNSSTFQDICDLAVSGSKYIGGQTQAAESHITSISDRKNKKQIQYNEWKLLWEESKTRISLLDVECCLESLRINYTSGFFAACQYILDQPIIITPKPYRLQRSKII